MKNRRSHEVNAAVAETGEGVVTETTGYASSSALERPNMDVALLSGGSKRLCASTQGANAHNSTSPSINHIAARNSTTPYMDGSLWKGLPDELIERVMTRLPAASLLRMGTVCKKWREIMTSKFFLEACYEVAAYKPYFVKISNNEHSRSLMSFDPSIHRWRDVPISYLPSEVGFPVSSSGGLVCFKNNQQASWRDGLVLFVSNPMTKAWKQLPRFVCRERPNMLVSMIMWKRPSHYKVLVAGEGRTVIFDSVEGKWHKAGCIPNGEEVRLRNVLTFCDGTFYCLTSFNQAILAFNIQDKVWSKVQTSSRLPGYCKFRNLVTCKGHVVLVGKSFRHQVQSVNVWLLEWKTMEWHEMGRMPQRMSEHFLGHPSKLHCCSHGDLIFLTSGKGRIGVLYDMTEDKWCSINAWPNHLNGFSYEPRLDSQV